jgi:hypothetical protein
VTSRAWLWYTLGLAVVVGLPIAGAWWRHGTPPGCALDGVRVDPAYRVEIVDADGRPHEFCCLRCAEVWWQRHPDVRSITVTDETTGATVEASAAHFVRSTVVTNPTTGNRTHAFRNRGDAERHAATFAGVILTVPDRPFTPR